MMKTTTARILVPLGREAHAIAQHYAIQQSTPQAGKQAYLNALTVYAVQSYLNWLQVETDFGTEQLALMIPDVGKLLCCPVLPNQDHITVPSIAAYFGGIAVQFRETLDQVELLGFVSIMDQNQQAIQVNINQLQSLERLIDQIPAAGAESKIVRLRSWFENTVSLGWQSLEALFYPPTVASAFGIRTPNDPSGKANRTSQEPKTRVSRGKVLDFGIQLAGNAIVLVVTIQPALNNQFNLLTQVLPSGGQATLPSQLQLAILDDKGAILLSAIARNADNWIQLEFSSQFGEQFSIQVSLGEVSLIEHFVI